MFQYAAGRALSLRRGVSHSLDISAFSHYELHNGFELYQVFCCPSPLASEVDIRRLLGWQSSVTMQRFLRHSIFAFLRRRALVFEPSFRYWPGIDDAPLRCYLLGYWQSEKYFQYESKTIRSDFSFKPFSAPQNRLLAERINSEEAISLHVRRGDYVHDPKTNTTLGLCALSYYEDAVNYISKRVNNPSFYIFSDDPFWVRLHFDISFPCTFIEHNHGAQSFNDMHLMSLCRHHIIANSSFSWWGAWLNPRPNKIVIAPKKWFANDYSSEDLLPDGWITL
ncbi:MAG: alpha-1,2-fucosyltransferase [Thermodesulfobacteriota bacterium]